MYEVIDTTCLHMNVFNSQVSMILDMDKPHYIVDKETLGVVPMSGTQILHETMKGNVWNVKISDMGAKLCCDISPRTEWSYLNGRLNIKSDIGMLWINNEVVLQEKHGVVYLYGSPWLDVYGNFRVSLSLMYAFRMGKSLILRIQDTAFGMRSYMGTLILDFDTLEFQEAHPGKLYENKIVNSFDGHVHAKLLLCGSDV